MDHTLSEEARQLIRLGDLEGASICVTSALSEESDMGNVGDVWSLHLTYADLLRLRGKTEQALVYLEHRKAEYPPLSNDFAAIAGLKRLEGYCLGLLGKYPQCHSLLLEAESIARDAGLLELQCEVHQSQAMIHYLQKNYEASDQVFRTILEESKVLGGWYFRGNAFWGIGKNLMIQEHYREAIPWLEDAQTIFESAKARLLTSVVQGELAVCYLGLGDDQRSLKLLQSSSEVARTLGVIQNYQVDLANIGNVYLYRGDHLRAIDYYRQALALAREIKDPVSIEKWSYNIRLAYARLREAVDQLDSKTA